MVLISLIGTLIAGGLGLAAYLYFFQKGQFEDIEDVKYQLFRNKEDE